MNFRDWMDLMRRSLRLLAALTLLGVLLGVGIGVTQARTWTSSAQVVLTPSVGGAGGQDLADASQYIGMRMKTYLRVASSPNVRERATEALTGSNKDLGEIAATWEPETTVITVQVTSHSAADARRDVALVEAAFIKEIAAVESGNDTVAVSVREIAAPDLPADPTSPRMAVNVLGGAVFGFLVGLAVALFRRVRKN